MHPKYLQRPMTMGEVERSLAEGLLHKRFTLKELQEKVNDEIELGGNDISAVNLADYNLMFEYEGFDVDLYCLIDRHGKYYITEIGVNHQ